MEGDKKSIFFVTRTVLGGLNTLRLGSRLYVLPDSLGLDRIRDAIQSDDPEVISEHGQIYITSDLLSPFNLVPCPSDVLISEYKKHRIDWKVEANV